MLRAMLNRVLSPDEVDRRARAAIDAALRYFGIDGELRVELMHETPKGEHSVANVTPDLSYLKATIRMDTDYYQCYPRSIWGDMGHEVAHLVTREAADLRDHLPAEPELRVTLYTRAIEQATVRLERMFVRDCPEPDWSNPSDPAP